MNDDHSAEPLTEPERYELAAAPRYQFELGRRDFCRALGGGVLVCLLAPPTQGQQPRRARRRGGGSTPQELGAWLHIGESGQITVYTGKVEIGQNIRTSLTQVVAEELRTPVSRIRMVMADTALTPFDSGTAGSRTTPVMAAQLRKVSAAARELLLDLAAESAKLKRETLEISDGAVKPIGTAKSFTFGDLTKGKKLTRTVAADQAVMPAADWKIAGTTVPKVDGRAMVTGSHQFASDMRLPGMMHGRVLRPTTLNGTLISANLQAAQSIPGVTAVRDGNFVGVAAPNILVADQALAKIQAEWKPGDRPSDKDLFDYLKKNAAAGQERDGRSDREGASIEMALAKADHKFHATYTVAYIAHAPLEPRAAVAEWKDGRLTVWTGTQRPFGVREELAGAFGIPSDRIRVIVPDMGSGYGGKHTGEAAVEAARLAKAAGKPVKLVWTREEEFAWAYFRPAGVIDVKSAAGKDGLITAWECHNYNSGASSIRPLYDIRNQRVEFHRVNSPLRQGSYRALASTANHFARESQIDDMAHALRIDPLDFRLKNLKDGRLRAVLQAAATRFGWGKSKPVAGTGIGIAGGSEKGSYVATCAEVAAEGAGGRILVVRLVTAFECGAIVNPDHLTNQVEGAVVMGLGGALFEAIRFQDGRIVNPAFADYRVPRFRDMPRIETVLLDRKDLPSAGGGETPIVAVAPAIGNAIFQATGVRRRSLPMAADAAS